MNSGESWWFATAESQFSGDLHTSSERSSCSATVFKLALSVSFWDEELTRTCPKGQA